MITKNASLYIPIRRLRRPVLHMERGESAYVLGVICGEQEPCFLLKKKEDYTSVYSLLPSVPHQIFHVLLTASCVHTYSVTGDALMAGGRYISMRSMYAGEKRIYLPPNIKSITDAETGESLEIKYHYVDFVMEDDEFRLFFC